MPWSVAFMVIMIVIVVSIARTSREKYRAQARLGPAPADTAEAHRLRDEVRQLRDRVQVLERVITDDRQSIDLTQEIERLRDR